MSVLSSLDTSLYTTPMSVMFDAPLTQPTTAENVEKVERYDRPNVAAEDADTPKVDLNNYYSNVQLPDSYTNGDLNSAFRESAKQFDNAVMQALENGYTPNDAVNVQKAMLAYKALMKAESSTFELFA